MKAIKNTHHNLREHASKVKENHASVFIKLGLTFDCALTQDIKDMIILSYEKYILNNIFLKEIILSKLYTRFKANVKTK